MIFCRLGYLLSAGTISLLNSQSRGSHQSHPLSLPNRHFRSFQPIHLSVNFSESSVNLLQPTNGAYSMTQLSHKEAIYAVQVRRSCHIFYSKPVHGIFSLKILSRPGNGCFLACSTNRVYPSTRFLSVGQLSR